MSTPDSEYPGWVSQEQHEAELAKASGSASGSISAEQAQAMIDQALARQAATYQDQIDGLAASLRGQVLTAVPAHAGGPGTEIAPTWSQWEQSQSIAAADAKAAAPAQSDVLRPQRPQSSQLRDQPELFPSIR